MSRAEEVYKEISQLASSEKRALFYKLLTELSVAIEREGSISTI
jgi:hypothetical protein